MAVMQTESVPVNVVGSSIFGRYPKISLEKTYNMFESDGWLVNYAGFQKAAQILSRGQGRALFHSVRGNFMIVVAATTVYKLQANLTPQFIGNLDTNVGEVYIDENLSAQICLVDGEASWIYNYEANLFTKQTLTFLGFPILPGYVAYHNTFFLIASSAASVNAQNWYVFQRATDDTISLNTQLSLQTKPDSAIAVKRIPGHGNNVIIFGATVAEVWTQVGGSENYRRIQSFNIDNGCVSISTIAANENTIVWLAQNENNAPALFVSDGSAAKAISTNGIDFLLQTIKRPDKSTAFLYRQDGHLFYQFTFYDAQDNLTLIYDFTMDKFYHVTDEDGNYHPARKIVYFNKKTYFISLNEPAIYEMGTEFTTYNHSLDRNALGDVIFRDRICKSLRQDDNSIFRIKNYSFWIEQGVDDTYLLQQVAPECTGELITEHNNLDIVTEDDIQIVSEDGNCFNLQQRPCVDMSFAKNGNQSFSNIVRRELNTRGHYRNRMRWHRLGRANEFTVQLRFWGFQRFVVQNGTVEVMR